MEIWNCIQPQIQIWFPDKWASGVTLSESDINLLINWEDSPHYQQVEHLLDSFWRGVDEWDYEYKDNRALYCHQPIPPDMCAFMIDVQQLYRGEEWPRKRLHRAKR